MSGVAILARNLGKRYSIGERERYRTLRESLAKTLSAPFRAAAAAIKKQPRRTHHPFNNEIWALDNVSFEVKRGEVLGIIGRNGAGKTTLLKILSRITEPTRGYAEIYGRVGSLLEVGTGFHPELNGRENIYLSGAVLGMKKGEINRKFDEIVAFSGVEKFIDTPVKRYSSGMYVRLAFAVAAHLEPEIFLVDEVLAVGDLEFQKKCLNKMGEIGGLGRTVILVSHNMSAIANLCSRAFLIDRGVLVCEGPPKDVIRDYMDLGREADGEIFWKDVHTAPGTGVVKLRASRILQDQGKPVAEVDVSQEIKIEIVYETFKEGARLCAVIYLHDSMGTQVLTSANHDSMTFEPDYWNNRPHPLGLFRSVCHIPAYLLNEGRYFVTPVICTDVKTRQVQVDHAISFTVVDDGSFSKGLMNSKIKAIGVVRPRLGWNTQYLGAPSKR